MILLAMTFGEKKNKGLYRKYPKVGNMYARLKHTLYIRRFCLKCCIFILKSLVSNVVFSY